MEPAGHAVHVAAVAPPLEYVPALQGPVQVATVRLPVEPYLPAGHVMHIALNPPNE